MKPRVNRVGRKSSVLHCQAQQICQACDHYCTGSTTIIINPIHDLITHRVRHASVRSQNHNQRSLYNRVPFGLKDRAPTHVVTPWTFLRPTTRGWASCGTTVLVTGSRLSFGLDHRPAHTAGSTREARGTRCVAEARHARAVLSISTD
jgi:hypothetical protein